MIDVVSNQPDVINLATFQFLHVDKNKNNNKNDENSIDMCPYIARS